MTRYDPQKHHRRSIRLKGWDYRHPGYYYITMVVQNRACLFGRIENDDMVLNDFGKIVDYHWKKLPLHFKHIELDDYCVMPNHLHGIIHIVRWPDGTDVSNDDGMNGDDVRAKDFHEDTIHHEKLPLYNPNVPRINNIEGNPSPLQSNDQTTQQPTIPCQPYHKTNKKSKFKHSIPYFHLHF